MSSGKSDKTTDRSLQGEVLEAAIRRAIPSAPDGRVRLARERASGMIAAAPFPTGAALAAAGAVLEGVAGWIPAGDGPGERRRLAERIAASRAPVLRQYAGGLEAIALACYFEAGDEG